MNTAFGKHLDGATIRRFRGISDLTLVDFGNINLFVGGNNSGKTTALEALYGGCRPLDPMAWISLARSREHVVWRRAPLVESLQWLFPNKGIATDEVENSILISLIGTFPVRAVEAHCSLFEAVPTEAIEQFDDEPPVAESRGLKLNVNTAVAVKQRQLSIPLQKETTRESGELLELFDEEYRFVEGKPFSHRRNDSCPMLNMRLISPHAHRLEGAQSSQVSKLAQRGELLEAATEIIRQFDSDILSIHILAPSGFPVTYVKHKNLGMTPITIFGDGLRKIIHLALSLPLCMDGIMLIDELESSIHAQWLPRVINWLSRSCKQTNVQLFATTHSLEAIDAVIGARSSQFDLVAFRVGKYQDKSEAVRFDQDMLVNLREELAVELRW